MASGARPSSNQRSESASPAKKTRAHDHEQESCVVCGDRACNHLYYGVSACHGCKCFFWRSVKNGLVYACRYNRACEINANSRSVCRWCRFQRCLNAGMQPESVRMQAPKIEGPEYSPPAKRAAGAVKRPLTATHLLDSHSGPHSSESDGYTPMMDSDESPLFKQARYDHAELVTKLSDLEERCNQLADFNENNNTLKPQLLTLGQIFAHPEYLECYRTAIQFCVRLHSATADELEFGKYRAFVKTFDYLHGFEAIGLGEMPQEDKEKLLTRAFAPLTIFEMCYGTTKATKDSSLLCLPTAITLSSSQLIPQNGFLSQKLVNNIVSTLTRTIEHLELSETEALLLKAIIMLNQEVPSLSPSTAIAVAKLRDRLHGALYQNCTRSEESPTIRFAKLLHILPKLTLLARELVEHIRAVQTFNGASRTACPLFYELYGDIFEEEREGSCLAKPMNSGFSSRCDSATSNKP